MQNVIKRCCSFHILMIAVMGLVGCQSMPSRDIENTSSIKHIDIPPVDVTSNIQQNELMFTNINQISTIVVRPTENVTLNANMPLMNYVAELTPEVLFFNGKDSSGADMICSVGSVLKPTVGPKEPMCLIEGDVKGVFDKVLIGRGFKHVPVKASKVPKFGIDEVAFNPEGPTKKEVYFIKRDGRNLFFSYKEYINKLVTKTSPVIVPLQDLPFTVNIKDLEFVITNVEPKLEYHLVKGTVNKINDNVEVKCVLKNSGNIHKTKLKVCGVMYGIALPI